MSLVRRDLKPTKRDNTAAWEPDVRKSGDGGVIYAFTFPEHYDLARPLIKIGFTSNLDRRAAEWKRQCGYTPRQLMHFSAEHHVKVENLIHAELRNQRLRECCCPGCEKKHVEWFDVQICRIAEVVALWTQWTRMKPYDEEGKLKEEWLTKLEDVDLTRRDCWKTYILGAEETETQE
jgi:hypothetical protein